jgi:hypothetical protein
MLSLTPGARAGASPARALGVESRHDQVDDLCCLTPRAYQDTGGPKLPPVAPTEGTGEFERYV